MLQKKSLYTVNEAAQLRHTTATSSDTSQGQSIKHQQPIHSPIFCSNLLKGVFIAKQTFQIASQKFQIAKQTFQIASQTFQIASQTFQIASQTFKTPNDWTLPEGQNTSFQAYNIQWYERLHYIGTALFRFVYVEHGGMGAPT